MQRDLQLTIVFEKHIVVLGCCGEVAHLWPQINSLSNDAVRQNPQTLLQ
jgi:hypothetical protein